MKELHLSLGDRSYPIFVGSGLLGVGHLSLWSKFLTKQVLIVSNQSLIELYGETLRQNLTSLGLSKLDVLALPDGEQFKNLDTLNLVFDRLLEKNFNRTATLVALGGGVIGDMTGFAAACYQRGIHFVQIPTTLLSQVDSSVGGKTGVNHALGKNMIGAFYQPKCVLIDTDVLETLPDKELSAGLAEVIKYGLIYDRTFFHWLEENANGIAGREEALIAHAIYRSCEIKAEVVASDEKESGIRAILNLGHTFGHAIETHQGYGAWLHGEAVAVGMLMACDLSERLGWLDEQISARAKALCLAFNLPTETPAGMTPADFMKHMSVDKKVLNKKLRLVLLTSLGEAVVTEDFNSQLLERTLEHFCSG